MKMYFNICVCMCFKSVVSFELIFSGCIVFTEGLIVRSKQLYVYILYCKLRHFQKLKNLLETIEKD